MHVPSLSVQSQTQANPVSLGLCVGSYLGQKLEGSSPKSIVAAPVPSSPRPVHGDCPYTWGTAPRRREVKKTRALSPADLRTRAASVQYVCTCHAGVTAGPSRRQLGIPQEAVELRPLTGHGPAWAFPRRLEMRPSQVRGEKRLGSMKLRKSHSASYFWFQRASIYLDTMNILPGGL